MSERTLSQIAYLNYVDVPIGSRDSRGRFLPRGRMGRVTEGSELTHLELTYPGGVGKKHYFRRVSPDLIVQDLGLPTEKASFISGKK